MRRSVGVPLCAPLLLTGLLAGLPAQAFEIMSDSERAEREKSRKFQAKPVLSCAPSSLRAKARRGETAELHLTIRNDGGQVLRWSLGKLPRWLAADALAGELKHEEEQRVVLHVRTQLVPTGSERADILVEAPGAERSPVTVSVAVEIGPGPAVKEPDGSAARGELAEVGGVVDDAARIPVTGKSSRGGLGVRVGYMLPGSGSASNYSSSPFLGVQYRMSKGEAPKLSFELGIDTASSDAEAVESSSRLTTGRVDVLFHMGGQNGGGWYLLSGLGSLFEESDVSGSGKAGLLDLGAGMTLIGGKLDVRLTHAVLLSGGNVSGMTLLSTAYRF